MILPEFQIHEPQIQNTNKLRKSTQSKEEYVNTQKKQNRKWEKLM